MSKGGPLSEPLSGLVVYVYHLGQPACGTTVPAKAYHAVPRVGRMLRSESLHHAAAAFPQPLQHHLFWEKLAPIRQHALPRTMGRSTAERSVASSGGVVGALRRIA